MSKERRLDDETLEKVTGGTHEVCNPDVGGCRTSPESPPGNTSGVTKSPIPSDDGAGHLEEEQP